VPAGIDGAVSIPGAAFPSEKKNFDVNRVVSLVGGDRKIDVVNVRTQGEAYFSDRKKFTLSQWRDYFNDAPGGPLRKKYGLLNVLSLEVSDAPRMMEHLESPDAVREIDWLTNLWPQPAESKFGMPPRPPPATALLDFESTAAPESRRPEYGRAHTQLSVDHVTNVPAVAGSVAGGRLLSELSSDKPKVRYYCLMGVKGAYTDWHIDFGGTSVWYHVVSGAKIFLLLPPTRANLAAYRGWSSSATQKSDWLGDAQGLDTPIYIETVTRGDTLLIPSGWIHAVFTPCDSLVFGGNYLHSLSMGMQASIHAVEEACQVEQKFRFPRFETTCWLAVSAYVRRLREQNPRRRRPLNRWEADGLCDLMAHMRSHEDAFAVGLPSPLLVLTLGESAQNKSGSPSRVLLDTLRDLLDSATDTEPRMESKHGPARHPDGVDHVVVDEDQAAVSPWRAEVERNRALGFHFSPELLERAVQESEAIKGKRVLERAIAEQKRNVARVAKQREELALSLSQTPSGGYAVAAQSFEPAAAGGPDEDAMLAFAEGKEDDFGSDSDSASSSESSSFEESLAATKKRPAPTNALQGVVHAPGTLAVQQQTAVPGANTGEPATKRQKKATPATPPHKQGSGGGVRSRLAKKLGSKLRR
jgi:Jumonji helical domain/JmjC domain, hydroxylase